MKVPDTRDTMLGKLLQDLREIIQNGRARAYAAADAVLIDTYWSLGRRIVEEEQNGHRRAEYGTGLLKEISVALSKDYGAGFNYRNVFYCRQFYLFFPDLDKLHTRVQNLSWSHFRALLRVSDEQARLWYLDEASRESWSVRTLDRNTFLPSQKKLRREIERQKALFQLQHQKED